MGDTSDNVPGVPGIGLKTAAQLIKEFGDLETLLERAREIKQPKRRETLIANADMARLSKKLVTLDCEAPVPVPLDELRRARTRRRRRLDRLPEGDGVQHPHAARRRTLRCRPAGDRARSAPHARRRGDPRGCAPRRGGRRDACVGKASAGQAPAARDLPEPAPAQDGVGTPASRLRRSARREASSQAFDITAYETITSLEAPAGLGRRRRASRAIVAVDTETSALDANAGRPRRLLPGAGSRARPPTCRFSTAAIPISSAAACVPGQIPIARRARGASSRCFEDPSVLKIGQNLKYDWVVLKRHGIEVRPFDDTMLISYVLDAGKGSHGMDELSRRHLGHTPMTFGEVAGTGRAR